jgi:hypothetical protein
MNKIVCNSIGAGNCKKEILKLQRRLITRNIVIFDVKESIQFFSELSAIQKVFQIFYLITEFLDISNSCSLKFKNDMEINCNLYVCSQKKNSLNIYNLYSN